MENVKIIPCNFNNSEHREGLVYLMNAYMSDPMGNYTSYTKEQEKLLVEGLKNHPSKLILFASYKEKLIGLTNCFINFATFTLKPFINIHDIVVLNDYRNMGVGRKLMEGIIHKAKTIGCSKITLEVRSDNSRAQALYQDLGFEESEPPMFFWTKYIN
ncbi:MAG: GNAT family N-acetyltransferase [Bacteroidales bacterium]|nr:GNAT family N-acetyltransferase [Bacteroidales bacterium]